MGYKNYYYGDGVTHVSKSNLSVTCDGAVTFKSYKCDNCFLGKKLFNSDVKDLKIVCDDKKEITAHKTVISTFSPIFAKMIEAQKHENNAIIEISDCDYEILQIAVNFCYGIFDAFPSDTDKLIEILEFSDKYEFNDLKKEIEFKIMPQITNTNISKLSNAAISSISEALKALCQSKLTHFINENDAIVMKDMESVDKNFIHQVFQNLCVEQGSVQHKDLNMAVARIVLFLNFLFSAYMLIYTFLNDK